MSLLKELRLAVRFRKKRFSSLGKHVKYKSLHSKFHYSERIKLGDYVHILDNCHFDGYGGITVADGTVVAPNCQLLTSNHVFDELRSDLLPFNHELDAKPISIGRGCWLARGVTVLPGVTIGDCVIVGAGAVVSKSIPSFSVAAGNPAVVVRQRDEKRLKELLVENRFFEKHRYD